MTLGRWCHDHTDAPCEPGRLVMTALSDGQFRFAVVTECGQRKRQEWKRREAPVVMLYWF